MERVFRNETLDATHLAEFHQVEGIVADYDLSLGDLIGVLSEFFGALGRGCSACLVVISLCSAGLQGPVRNLLCRAGRIAAEERLQPVHGAVHGTWEPVLVVRTWQGRQCR